MEQPYWEDEVADVRVIGRTRIAHYKKAGVLQFSVLSHGLDGVLHIGKTVCIYKNSIVKDNSYKRNDDGIRFLMDILHLWRKETRENFPHSEKKYNKCEIVVLPDKETLDKVSEVG